MCLICDRIEMIRRGENPWFVRELETGYVVIGDHQHFRGYTLFLYKKHGTISELYHLPMPERTRFLAEMTLVAEAAARAFGAEKMNYELLGMGDSHLHWHLFPRRAGDIGDCGNRGVGPVWWYPMEKMYAEENRVADPELAELRRRLNRELDRLLNT